MIIKSKQFILLALVIILATIILLTVLIMPQRRQPAPTDNPTPSATIVLPSIIPMDTVPYRTEQEGGGVDTSDSMVLRSTEEIGKLQNLLPYKTTLELSSGRKVEVIIPAKELQLNDWTLTIQIFDIDYQLPTDNRNYEAEKLAFKEAVDLVFDYLSSGGADPTKIIISWGDRAYIQERAEQWLSE